MTMVTKPYHFCSSIHKYINFESYANKIFITMSVKLCNLPHIILQNLSEELGCAELHYPRLIFSFGIIPKSYLLI